MNNLLENFNEKWLQWKPSELYDLNGNYYLEKISEKYGKFEITLEHTKTKKSIRFIFSNVFVSRYVEEGLRFILFELLEVKYGVNFYKDWAFFQVQNSDLLQWIHIYSAGTSDMRNIKHFVIMTQEVILDILCASDPQVIK